MPTNAYAYMTGTFDPWGVSPSNAGSPDAAMTGAFGAGGWDKYQGFSASAFTAGYKFIYLDGGDGVSDQFRAFVSANLGVIQTFVANGGHLFLNEAGWTYNDFNLGFGVTTHWGASDSAHAVDTATGIFTSATGMSWTGSSFSHEYLTGSGLHTIISGTYGAVLADMNYGAGHVAFGGMTDPYFDQPGAAADQLRVNILKYEAGAGTVTAAPTGLTLDPSSDTGIAGDHITRLSHVQIDGVAAAGASVTLYDGATAVGTGVAGANGAFQITTSGLADGTHTLVAKATLGGTTSAASAGVSVTVDTVAPQAPGVSLAHDSGAAGDGVTNDAALTVQPAEAGGTLLYSLDGGAFGTTAPVLAQDGSQDGTHTVQVEQVDVAGNVSAAGSLTFTLDTVAPQAPGLALAHDSGLAGDGLTNDASLAVTPAEAGGSLLYSLDGGAFGAAAPALAQDGSKDGSHTVAVEQVDAAGNVSAAAHLTFTLDTVAPAAPTGVSLDASADSAAKGDGLTNVNRLVIDGTAESGSTVVITDAGQVVGQGLADASGAFQITTVALADGTHGLGVQATDAAGNTGAAASLSVSVDTTAPVPQVTDVVMTDLGALITGRAEAGLLVKVFDHGVLVGSATAQADGAWSLLANAPGNVIHAYSLAATDQAGNLGGSAGEALYTPASNKALVGGAGDDVLVGRPNDVLTGGGGHDSFVFNPSFGRETVSDFAPGGDHIVFDHSLFGGFEAVMAHARQVGGDTVISYDPGDTVTLKNVALSSLHAGDFLFI